MTGTRSPIVDTKRAGRVQMLCLFTAGVITFVAVVAVLVCLVFGVSVGIEHRTFTDQQQATLPTKLKFLSRTRWRRDDMVTCGDCAHLDRLSGHPLAGNYLARIDPSTIWFWSTDLRACSQFLEKDSG